MRHHKVLLQLGQLGRLDRNVAQGAEAGCNAVNRFFLVAHLPVKEFAAFGDAAPGLIAEFKFHTLVKDFPYPAYAEPFRPYMVNFHGFLIILIVNHYNIKEKPI